jgi:hypothetical protein
MYQLSGSTQAALDYDSTIIGALELSEKKRGLAVQLPGVRRYSRQRARRWGGLRLSRLGSAPSFADQLNGYEAVEGCQPPHGEPLIG